VRIAISTGGGDAPGLNAVIRAAVLAAVHRGWECFGVKRGFGSLLGESDLIPLGPHEVRGITHLGGTILGTSSRGDPLKWRVQRPDGSWEERDRSQELLDSFHAHRLDALIAIAQEARDDPELVKSAPYSTPVRRLDEARAARKPVLRWEPRSADGAA